jgi:ferredoxin
MAVLEKSPLLGFLEQQSQKAWIDTLAELESSIHPVDRPTTRIWFGFWPMKLREALSSSPDAPRLMDLEGNWKLEAQIDGSVRFFYGAHFWPSVKKAVLSEKVSAGSSLASIVRRVSEVVAETEKVDRGLVLGISAVALMLLRQVGEEALARLKDSPAEGPLLSKDPERVLANRERKSGGLVAFLKGVNRSWDVRWDELRPQAVYRAISGQDLAMAGASDRRDYRELDYRRVDGPVPVECRVGSCGYCWVGVVSGRDRLSPMTDFERERLRYFGYDAANAEGDSNPHIRLACQAQCHGDLTLVVSPWNGELSRLNDEGRKKMGTA